MKKVSNSSLNVSMWEAYYEIAAKEWIIALTQCTALTQYAEWS